MPTATVNGAPLHYVDEGAGPAVVLLHAFPLSSAMWEPQVASLASTHRVVAPDARGFGASPPPESAPAAMGHYAADVAALIAALDLGPVALVGLSMGGYVAFEVLRRHHPIVRALVLADTRAQADRPEIVARRTSQQEQVAGGDVAGVLDALLPGLLSEATHRDRPEVVARVRSIMETASPPGIVAALEAMKSRTDATAELAGIGVPALVIVGDDDALSPPEVAAAMAGALPRGRLAVIPGAGHLSNVENPTGFTAALEAFLGEVGPP